MQQLTTISPNQFGFRPGRSTTDPAFSLLTHLQDKHESQQEQLVVFVDLENAYDTVLREYITGILWHRAVPEQYVALVEDIYSGSHMRVQTIIMETLLLYSF